ncbi:MAG: BatD family protein [Bacteroidota bacterium]|nr:BatD family protein [Bacteroidota bacterium]MDP4213652.1 BatD family protein [Bacteroidota bacterium]MDP4251629.1 BatD family protein [Bacteroidota bacterium]
MEKRELSMEKGKRRINNTLRPIFCFLLFTVYFLPAHAQDSPAVKTSVDKTHILIGEPFRLSFDVSHPAGITPHLMRPDTIPHFVFLGKDSADSLVSETGTGQHLEWKLTSFDSGVNKIPSFSVVIGDRTYHSDSVLVDVSYGGLDTVKEYHDIHGIIDKENPAVKYILWVLLGITLLGIILFVRSATRPAAVPEVREEGTRTSGLSPLDEAMASLDMLKKMLLTDATSVKKYYSGMNDVLRVFLNRSMGLSTMVRTNEELILQLSGLNMDKETFTRLAGALRMSDFVKFAKYMPDVYDNERNLEVIRSSIVLINETR